MKAIVSVVAGGPDSLTLMEVATPVPREDEVLVRIKACGLNYPDLLMVAGTYQAVPVRPFIPGIEMAGLVVAKGKAVKTLCEGDRVVATLGSGGMAQFIAVKASLCQKLPGDMPFDIAAAFMTTYGTSYHALKQRARLASGETLLVLGASGGVGLAAVELGKALGAKVIAGVSSQDKLELALKHGADKGLIYPTDLDSQSMRDLSGLFKAAGGPRGIDVVYDPVGGPLTEAAFRALNWRGRHLVVGFTSGIAHLPLNLPLLKGAEIVGVFFGRFTQNEPEAMAQNLTELLSLYRQGRITPFIFAHFGLDRAEEAFLCLKRRQVMGKIVFVP